MMGKLTKAQRSEQEHLYGCSVDLAEDETPDGCVLDYGAPEECIHASKRRIKWTCPYWVLKSEHRAGRAALAAQEP